MYQFGKPYEEIYAELKAQNEALYTHNGLLTMLQRNMGVKRAPEKWQHNRWAQQLGRGDAGAWGRGRSSCGCRCSCS